MRQNSQHGSRWTWGCHTLQRAPSAVPDRYASSRIGSNETRCLHHDQESRTLRAKKISAHAAVKGRLDVRRTSKVQLFFWLWACLAQWLLSSRWSSWGDLQILIWGACWRKFSLYCVTDVIKVQETLPSEIGETWTSLCLSVFTIHVVIEKLEICRRCVAYSESWS